MPLRSKNTQQEAAANPVFSAQELSELAESFVREARDLLEEANSALLELERHPQSPEAINALFRCVHSIKGAAGLFDLPALTHLVHAGEDLLGAMREGRLAMDAATADDLLAGLDHVGNWLSDFATNGTEPDGCMGVARRYASAYRARLDGQSPSAENGHEPQAIDTIPEWAIPHRDALLLALGNVNPVLLSYVPEEGCFFAGEDPLRLVLATPGLAWMDIKPRADWGPRAQFDPYACNLEFLIASTAPRLEVEHHFRYVDDCITLCALDLEQLIEAGPPLAEKLTPIARELLEAQQRALAIPGRHGQVVDIENVLRSLCRSLGLPCPLPQGSATPDTLADALASLLQQEEPAQEENNSGQTAMLAENFLDRPAERTDTVVDRTLRVEQGKVDALMNLVGELVVAKNALPFLARDAEIRFGSRELAREIKDKYSVIDRITRQMQNAVMDIRMMPVSELFKRFPRLVRDIARKQNKKVDLVIEGETTEADKNIIEALADPLTHILRNSLDHGICPPEVRVNTNKPAVATIRLSAKQEGDSVIITVSDDGRGIDPERVRAKAVERGLLDAERAAQLSRDQAVQLVFLPGFSTAEQVSDLSGRGVGMDAVRSAVERLGGSVALESRLGEGTSIRLKLPLSMAVTRVLTVDLAGQLYGVPMELVVETVRIEPANIRRMKSSEAVVLRDQVIPITRLRNLLGMEPRPAALESVLILRLGSVLVGLVIDDFGTGMDIILKPFAGILANLGGFSGTAVLGDGRVLLVLNLKEIL